MVRKNVSIACLLATCALGCGGSAQTVGLKFRADGVEGASNLTVKLTIGGHTETHASVAGGTYFDMGQVEVGTEVAVEVTNGTSAGSISANVLIDDCFRGTDSCSGNCVARAGAVLKKEVCANY